jgi:pSer/pThr/pTyr-binding forkhead associated (FHA) protein
MARLVVMYGSRHTRTIALDVERLVIGRGKKAGLSLRNQTISREHCVIDLEGTRHVLSDLESTSGTFVNGMRIEAPVTLEQGDNIELGKHTLKYERDAIESGLPESKDTSQQDASSAGFWEQGLAEGGFGDGPGPAASAQAADKATPWDSGAVESAAEVTGRSSAVSGAPEDYAGTMLASEDEIKRIRETLLVQQKPHLAVVVKGDRRLVALEGDTITVGYYDEADFQLPGSRFFGRKQFKIYPSGTAWMIKVESFWAQVELGRKRLRGSELLRGGEVIKAGGYNFKFDKGDAQ